MKKQNNTFQLLFALICVLATTSGCDFQNNSKEDKVKTVKHNEEYVQRVNSGAIKDDDYQGSVYRVTSAIIDSVQITIRYGSPGVRKRVIWGKLVPYDTVWVSGALTATSIEFSKDITIDGKKLKTGRYAFFTIPGRKRWKVIFNKDYQQHNADDYDVKKDVLRLDIVPDTLSQQTRRLTYSILKGVENDIDIALMWEKLSIPFKVKTGNSK